MKNLGYAAVFGLAFTVGAFLAYIMMVLIPEIGDAYCRFFGLSGVSTSIKDFAFKLPFAFVFLTLVFWGFLHFVDEKGD